MANTKIPVELSSTPGIVDNSNATAITIDSSENVGIGTASPQKALNVFADGTAPVRFERNTSDGQVIQIYKDGSPISSIGTNSTGIGNSSPQAGLDLGSSAKGTWSSGNAYHYPSGNAYIKVQGTAAEDDWIGIAGNYNQSSGSANLLLQANLRLVNEQAGNYIGSEAQSVTSADITFGKLIGGSSTGVNATKSEFMRIDSSGNLLVGTTATDRTTDDGVSVNGYGFVDVSRSSNISGRFTRRATDGNILDFRKDSTTIGSIGSFVGYPYIGKGDTTLLFNPDGDRIIPRGTNGGARDATIDLGGTSDRFKDLYLSGGAYLGGTAAANQLDDYEEGTWTAELKGSTGSATTPVTRTGTYTKVGNLVHVQVSFVNVNTTGASGAIQVTGLPFTNTSANASTVTLGQYTKLAHSADSNPIAYINPSVNLIQMTQFNDSAVGANWFITGTTGVYLYISATYTI